MAAMGPAANPKLKREPNRRLLIILVGVVALITANAPPAYAFVADFIHERIINSDDYKASYGHWDVIDLPSDIRVNAVHAALLDTGKILIIAGSGNDPDQFAAGTFKTLLYDPVKATTTLVPTPTDLFCAGHAFLPNGNLLVAGGTLRYEILQPNVTKAAGLMVVKNEDPSGEPRQYGKNTEFVGPTGKKYYSTADFIIKPATKKEIRKGLARVTASQTTVWVESADTGPAGVTPLRAQYKITGLTGTDVNNIYGLAEKMTLDKQEYQGRKETYEFSPRTERYERVGDMQEQRWYPTLTSLADGSVLAVSGLDGAGQVVNGINEIYDPVTRKWTTRTDLKQYFPTYPSLFQTATPGKLFYSGSNAGYGPADKGRDAGFWDLTTNTFTKVPGLRDTDLLETSGSAWAGPVQDQKVTVVGGGGIGDSPRSTARIDVIDLSLPNPRFIPGPSLPEGTRYPILVQLPDDTTLITGGSKGYRGRQNSDNHNARIYHPAENGLSLAADPLVGRDYHSAGLLLPDGRVMTMGSNPLFSDKLDTITAEFEQRIEIFTPPYLFNGARPVIVDGPATLKLGETATYTTSLTVGIATARLIRPSSSTHVTNTDQRIVALELERADGSVKVTVPKDPTLVPPGYYMLFVTNYAGVPSVAKWVKIT